MAEPFVTVSCRFQGTRGQAEMETALNLFEIFDHVLIVSGLDSTPIGCGLVSRVIPQAVSEVQRQTQ